MTTPKESIRERRWTVGSWIAFALIAAIHFVATFLCAGLGFRTYERSAAVSWLFFGIYDALSVPALLLRRIVHNPIGLDPLGWGEMAIDSVLYGVAVVASWVVFERHRVHRSIRLLAWLLLFIILLTIGLILSPNA